MESYGAEAHAEEHSTPAKKDGEIGSPLSHGQLLARSLRKLAWLRQGHQGPEVGTKYNLPTQGG